MIDEIGFVKLEARMDAVEKTQEEHHRDINGNGKPGLKAEVAELKVRVAIYAAIGSTLGGALTTYVGHLIK